MRYYFDTEFIEDGRTIDLISIGVVREDGAELYAINMDCKLGRASPWVKEHVLVHIFPVRAPEWLPHAVIRDELVAFVGDDPKPEFWAYYADYDWVALCQLFGTMMDLPKHFPKFCMDLKQLSVMLGGLRFPKQVTPEHHALNDAQWVKDVHETLLDLAPPMGGLPILEHRLRLRLERLWAERSSVR